MDDSISARQRRFWRPWKRTVDFALAAEAVHWIFHYDSLVTGWWGCCYPL